MTTHTDEGGRVHEVGDPPAGGEALPVRFTQPIERAVIYMVLAIEAGSFVMVFVILAATKATPMTTALVLALMLLPVVMILKARLTVTLREDRLVWVFRPFWRSSVRYDRIAGVEVTRVDAMRDFMGWGPKVSTKGYGAIAKSGPAVRIDRVGKKPLYLTSDDAELLCAAVLDRAVAVQAAESPVAPEADGSDEAEQQAAPLGQS